MICKNKKIKVKRGYKKIEINIVFFSSCYFKYERLYHNFLSYYGIDIEEFFDFCGNEPTIDFIAYLAKYKKDMCCPYKYNNFYIVKEDIRFFCFETNINYIRPYIGHFIINDRFYCYTTEDKIFINDTHYTDKFYIYNSVNHLYV